MDYQPKNLLPLLKTLSEKYTSKSSTSVSYETAQKLMGAILYCIRENSLRCDDASGFSETGALSENGILMETGKTPSAERAYEQGYVLVVEKIKQAHTLYNRIMQSFDSYGNQAYGETLRDGLPEFFKWYDPKFDPQNHIILIDYPMLKEPPGLNGIDLMYEYLSCIELEQLFLSAFPKKYVHAVLLQYHRDYAELYANITEIVVKNVLVNLMLGLNVPVIRLSDADCEKLQQQLLQTDEETLNLSLDAALMTFISRIFEGNITLRLYRYLKQATPGIAAGLLNAAENNNISFIFGGALDG